MQRNTETQSKPVKVDTDLKAMDEAQLKAEIIKLREGIRYHRDQTGDDRCWLDDISLYELLPESKTANFKLPPRKEFLKNCARFFDTRQDNPGLHSWTELTEEEFAAQMKQLLAGAEGTEREKTLARLAVKMALTKEALKLISEGPRG